MSVSVLVVDDSPILRKMVKKAVGMSGLDVGEYVEAANGKEALTVLDARSVDLVLTDINMPEMDGAEFIRQLAKNGKIHETAVVIVSTERNEPLIAELKQLGACGYITKPFRPEELRDVLKGALASRPAAER